MEKCYFLQIRMWHSHVLLGQYVCTVELNVKIKLTFLVSGCGGYSRALCIVLKLVLNYFLEVSATLVSTWTGGISYVVLKLKNKLQNAELLLFYLICMVGHYYLNS